MDQRTHNALAFLTRAESGDDHVMRARRLLERAIRQRWADGMLEPRVGNPQIADLERMMRPPSQTIDVIDDHAYEPSSAIGRLTALLGLGPTESDLFAVLLACETDPTASRLAQFLGGTGVLSVDTIYEIAYRPRRWKPNDATALLHTDLAAEGPARGLRFLVVEGGESRSFLQQGVRIHPRLVAWLLGRVGLPQELSAKARLIASTDRDSREPLDDLDHNARIATVSNAYEQGGQLVVLHGAIGSGRELLLRAAAQAHGRPLLAVSGRDLSPDLVVAAFREAVLQGALLAFVDAEDAMTPEGLARLRECLALFGGTVAFYGLGEKLQAVAALRTTIEITIPIPSYQRRIELWRAYFDPNECTVSDGEWKSIAGLYNLGLGGIERASRVARDVSRAEGKTIDRACVGAAVRQLFESDLSNVAKRMEVSQTWEDVVLPEDVMTSVVGVVDRVQYRNEVLGEWGFGRKVGKGLGLTVLFSGQPGTGKSMVAGLIARELGLDMYVIDLSRIMSKWLGETEKNLGRAFDAAEAGHVLLLFDEADSLLGKRTTVNSSNDRHANLETNFILARLEQFHGIAVFTTNIVSAIDPAIMRRMAANIQFPFPDAESRAELWRKMIPAEAPVQGPIDFVKLARQFEISGGFIKNVVLRAAFLAAREGKPISTHHLEKSARGEYGDRGALTAGGRLA